MLSSPIPIRSANNWTFSSQLVKDFTIDQSQLLRYLPSSFRLLYRVSFLRVFFAVVCFWDTFRQMIYRTDGASWLRSNLKFGRLLLVHELVVSS